MAGPSSKRKREAKKPPVVFEPHPDDERPVLPVKDAEGADELLPVDGEAYLRWLETGKGDPHRCA